MPVGLTLCFPTAEEVEGNEGQYHQKPHDAEDNVSGRRPFPSKLGHSCTEWDARRLGGVGRDVGLKRERTKWV